MTLFSLFQQPYIGFCITSFVAAICALLFFWQKKEKYALASLFLAAILVRLFMAYQDAFLHPWDERIHAVVARNMMSDPFTPILRMHPINGDYPFCWTCSHIWLHKQPLFLWQMALSMKIFGVSEFVIRYPAVFMGAIMVLLLYSIAISVTGNKAVAIVSALLLCFNNYQLELISGFYGMDHNDVAFCFYVLASIWAYVQYSKERKLPFAMLLGFFAGCAVLTKWLTGLVIFGGWGVNILLTLRKDAAITLVHWLLALAISVAVFLPWQIYIFHRFPMLAAYEMQFNARHITEVIEGHRGSNFFYIDNFERYFGEVGWFFVPAGLMLLLIRIRRNQVANRHAAIALMVVFTAVFVFFSHIVPTKIESYFFVVAPIGILFMAIASFEVFRQVANEGYPGAGRVAYYCVVMIIVVSILNPELIVRFHNPADKARLQLAEHTRIYKRLKHDIPANTALVLNTTDGEDYCAAFYDNDIPIYTSVYDHVLDSLQSVGATVAVYKDREYGKIPQRLKEYRHTFFINEELR